MMTEDRIKARLEAVESDERLDYPPADIRANVYLAIEQIMLKTESHTLRDVLGIPRKRFPRKND